MFTLRVHYSEVMRLDDSHNDNVATGELPRFWLDLPEIKSRMVVDIKKASILCNGLDVTANVWNPTSELWIAPSQIMGFEIIEENVEAEDKDAMVKLRRRTPEEREDYIHQKLSEWQLEKRKLTERS